MIKLLFAGVLTTTIAFVTIQAQTPQTPAPAAGQRGAGGTTRAPRVDMNTMANPIEPLNTVWIEDMTQLEIRDALKAGKNTALIFAGGMENNGPYIVVDQHGSLVHAQCDQIARKLGDALCAPILHIAPGNPETSRNPGSIVLRPEVFKSVVQDEATSLKTQGFKYIYTMVDHGSSAGPMTEISNTLAEQWKGSGVRIAYVKEYYNNTAIEQFVRDVLGVNEVNEGFHDDYFATAPQLAIDPVSARIPQRIKAGITKMNGTEVTGQKGIEDGKKIMAFRTDMTVKAILRLGK
jgi:creatinine amidohydrolase/Fe(II)-dependent formamide hydrolase-like protein